MCCSIYLVEDSCKIESIDLLFHFREDGYQKEDNTYNDIRFEESCILYNIGALYSKLGANELRKTHEVGAKKKRFPNRIRYVSNNLEYEKCLHLFPIFSCMFRKTSRSLYSIFIRSYTGFINMSSRYSTSKF